VKNMVVEIVLSHCDKSFAIVVGSEEVAHVCGGVYATRWVGECTVCPAAFTS